METDFFAIAKRQIELLNKQDCENSISQGRQLAFWPDDKLNAPAVILRSALFGLVERGKRKAVQRKEIASWRGSKLLYTGFQLDQADLDIYLCLIDLQKNQVIGKEIETTERRILQASGRRVGGRDVEWLRNCMSRLTACEVSIEVEGKEYFGPLIVHGVRDKETGGLLKIVLHPKMAELFGSGVWQDRETRNSLGTDLSKWLLGYLSSHSSSIRKPHIVRIETLMALCGTRILQRHEFKKKLSRAMAELQAASAVAFWGYTESGCLQIIKTVHKGSKGRVVGSIS